MNETHTLTILAAINRKREDITKTFALLEEQQKKLDFLNPKTVLVDSIDGIVSYSRFCIEKISDCFDTDFVLIVQNDGKIMDESAWQDSFFSYDYVGAPWQKDSESVLWRLSKMKKDPFNLDFFVGNGGFSLRSKRLCSFIKENSALWNGKENEDLFIAVMLRDLLEKNGFRIAPYEIAKQFSVERDVYTNQFGAHKWILKDGKKLEVSKIV